MKPLTARIGLLWCVNNLPDGTKQFRPFHFNGTGWVCGDPPGLLPLFGLPQVLVTEGRIYVCGGEKCAEAARLVGLAATTSAHGCKSAHKSDWTPLAGREVVILPDNNEGGGHYADDVAGILARLDPPATVRNVRLPNLPDGGDIVDYVERRDSTESDDINRAIEALADAAPPTDPNSIRAPIEREHARIEFSPPLPISQLGDGDDVAWSWGGYLARNHVTLFTGIWKSGKTTLLAYLLRDFGPGGDLAGSVEPTRVLMVSEETRGLWVRHRDDLHIGDHAHLMIRPFMGRPSPTEWLAFVGFVTGLIKSDGFGVVIFDTISTLWAVTDENDAARMLSALTPLHAITEAGAALLLVHHPRKSDGAEGQAARGSGALPGFVDVILELRRFAPENHQDRRRVLTAYSRFDETLPEAVIELTETGYRCVGTKAEATGADRMAVVATLLPTEPPGMTGEDVRAAWPGGGIPKPGERTTLHDLEQGAKEGRWSVNGAGVKGDPLRFWVQNLIRARSPSIGAPIESNGDGTSKSIAPGRSRDGRAASSPAHGPENTPEPDDDGDDV